MQKLLLLFGALVLSFTSISLSQSTPSSWSKLSGLKAGQAIQVATSSKKYVGTFVSASDTAMTIEEASREQSIQRQDVRSVKLVSSNSRAKHVLIGAAVGAGSAAVVGAAAGGCSGSCFFGSNRGVLAGIGAAIGGIVGAVVGAVVPVHGTTVYEAGVH